MATRSELMAGGIPPLAANGLGQSLSSALTATGTGQSTGLTLTSAVNLFSTVANGTCATLQSANNKSISLVYNGGANTLQVFCASGEAMNGTTNGSIQIPTGKAAILVPHNNQWGAVVSA